jgi:beta-lactamase class A
MEKLQQIINNATGTWGVYIKPLDSDEPLFAYNENEQFYPASVAKIYMVMFVLDQVEKGKMSLEDRVTLDEKHRQSGTGILHHLHNGLEFSVEDLITFILIVSDEIATKLLAHKVSLTEINSYMEEQGFESTHLDIKNDEMGEYSYGESTPKEIARLLEGIYNNAFLNEEHSKKLLGIMQESHFSMGIRRYLPGVNGVKGPTKMKVANKEGTSGEYRHDTGIVYADRPYVICVFSKEIDDESMSIDNRAVLTIADIAKEAHVLISG